MNTEKNSLIPPVPRHQWWRWFFFYLCIFICGGFLGSVLTQALIWHHGPFGPPSGPKDLDERANHIVARMRDDFGLTDEQTNQIRTIVKKNMVSLEDTLQSNFDGMNLEIRAVLNNEQISKFNEWINKRLERLPGPPGKNRRHERFPPPPGENMKHNGK